MQMELYKNKSWLYEQYIINKRDCNNIAKEVNRDPKTIWSWINKFGIQTRKRGAESSTGTFKKNHKYGIGRIQSESTKEKIRQARLIDGHVPYLKDGIHWLKHENAVSPNYKGGITPERQKIYSSIEWSNCVLEVWKRDNATCQNCGKHQNDDRNNKFHIHHIKSFAEYPELRTKTENLILLCPKCHKKQHQKQK